MLQLFFANVTSSAAARLQWQLSWEVVPENDDW